MSYLKKIGIGFSYIISVSLISILLLTVLSYFQIIKSETIAIIELMIAIIGTFIGSFKVGKNSKQKGWFEGLKFGVILTIFLIILNLIFKNKLDINQIIYYLIIVTTSIFGSIIGINKNTKKK